MKDAIEYAEKMRIEDFKEGHDMVVNNIDKMTGGQLEYFSRPTTSSIEEQMEYDNVFREWLYTIDSKFVDEKVSTDFYFGFKSAVDEIYMASHYEKGTPTEC